MFREETLQQYGWYVSGLIRLHPNTWWEDETRRKRDVTTPERRCHEVMCQLQNADSDDDWRLGLDGGKEMEGRGSDVPICHDQGSSGGDLRSLPQTASGCPSQPKVGRTAVFRHHPQNLFGICSFAEARGSSGPAKLPSALTVRGVWWGICVALNQFDIDGWVIRQGSQEREPAAPDLDLPWLPVCPPCNRARRCSPRWSHAAKHSVPPPWNVATLNGRTLSDRLLHC